MSASCQDAESESLLLPASPSSRSVPTLYPSVILLGSEEEPARLSSEGTVAYFTVCLSREDEINSPGLGNWDVTIFRFSI